MPLLTTKNIFSVLTVHPNVRNIVPPDHVASEIFGYLFWGEIQKTVFHDKLVELRRHLRRVKTGEVKTVMQSAGCRISDLVVMTKWINQSLERNYEYLRNDWNVSSLPLSAMLFDASLVMPG